MAVRLRPYRPGDFQVLWEIDQACFPPDIAYSQRELRLYVGLPSAFTLVAEADEFQKGTEKGAGQGSPISQPKVAGFLVANLRAHTGHIITIDVRSEFRRQNIGSRLLNAAEEQLRIRNCAAVHLETAVDNVPALSFYKRHGYSVIRTIPRYYSNGVDGLLLEKSFDLSSSTKRAQK